MDTSNIQSEKNIFGLLFQLSNALQTYLDKMLKEDGITAKQFLLMIVIGSFGNEHPTFGELAERFGTSHQNVKQIALKLEQNAFITIEKDPADGRARRIVFTKKAYDYWDDRDEIDLLTFGKLFKGIDTNTIETTVQGLLQIQNNIKEL